MKCDLENEKMTNLDKCKFCHGGRDDGEPLCGDIINDGNIMDVVHKVDGWFLEMWNHFDFVNEAKINFCPICGRKLED